MTVRHATEPEKQAELQEAPPALPVNPLVLVGVVMMVILAVWALIWIPLGF